MTSSTFYQWREYPIAVLVSIFAGLSGFLVGYDAGVISGILDMECFKETFGHIQPDGTYELAANDKSLIVAMLFLGTIVGAMLGHPCGDYLGRRWAIILGYSTFLVGVAFETGAVAIVLFTIGRVIAGIGIGLTNCVALMYQSECAPKSIRGAIVSTNILFMNIGLFIAAILVNGTKNVSFHGCYRIPISIQLIWGVILTVGTFFSPESPRYLVLRGNIEKAHKCQARLISSSSDDLEVKADVKALIANVEQLKTYESHSWLDCFKMGPQKNLLRTLVGIFITLLQQFCGIDFILYYGTSYLSALGASNSFTIMIIIQIINVLMIIPGILLVDTVGRRFILIAGAIGMAISEFFIAIIGVAIGEVNDIVRNSFIIFSCVFIACFSATWGATPWVIIGEIYPISIQAKCISLISAVNWLFVFIITYAIPYMIDEGKGNMESNIFFVWGSVCLLCLIFSIFCVWETKDLSLEQVNYLIRNSSPMKSSTLNRKLKTISLIEGDTSSNNILPDFLDNNSESVDEISPISTNVVNSKESIPLLNESK